MKAFLFDLDDTLYDQMQPFFAALMDIGIEILEKDKNDLFLKSREYSNKVFETSFLGKISMEKMYIYRIKKTLEDYDILISDEKALLFQKYYEAHQKTIELSSEMKKMLDDINEKAILGIITNGPSEHQRNKIKTLQLDRWFENSNIVISGDLNIIKPNPEIFTYAIKEKEILPKNCFYIGDSFENDIVGAANAGMKTVWFNRRNKIVKSEIKPDYIVYSEKDLHMLLKTLIQ